MHFALPRVSRAVLIVFLLAVGLKLYHIHIPFIEPYNSLTRMSLGASVARNYHESGYDFLNPQINENGPGPYLFNAEMPVGPYLAALGYGLRGGAEEWIARLVSVLFSMGTLVFLYLLARLFFSKTLSLSAVLFMAVSPLSLALSRAIQPEAVMIFSSVASFYFFERFGRSASKWNLWWATVFAFFAIGSKFYNVYIYIPLFFIAYSREGLSLFRRPQNYFLAFVSASALTWFVYMWHLGNIQKLAYIVYQSVATRGPENMSHLDLLLSPHYLSVTGKVFLIHLLTPLGALFFVMGLFSMGAASHGARFAWCWLAAAVLLILVTWRTVIDHSYYQLPLVAPCSLFVGKGVERFFSTKLNWLKGLAATICLCASLWVAVHLYRGIFFIPPERMVMVEAGKAVEANTPKGSLVVASYEAGPMQLYYCHRKGWAIEIRNRKTEDLVSELEGFRAQGAQFLLLSYRPDLDGLPEYEAYLRSRYRVTLEKPNYILFDLQ